MDDIDTLVDELQSAGERLRSGELDPADAAQLVERLAGLAAQIGSALEREARAPTPGGSPGQETLL